MKCVSTNELKQEELTFSLLDAIVAPPWRRKLLRLRGLLERNGWVGECGRFPPLPPPVLAGAGEVKVPDLDEAENRE